MMSLAVLTLLLFGSLATSVLANEPGEAQSEQADCELPNSKVDVETLELAQANADCTPRSSCCKVCSKGQACGNSALAGATRAGKEGDVPVMQRRFVGR